MMSWGAGWWWVGGIVMIVCMVLMVRMMMMGHGDHQGHAGSGDAAERTLANRLAAGEIDVEEYERLLSALRANHPA